MTDYGHWADAWTARRWPAIRARGRTRFLLVRGTLGWGGAMFVVSVIALWLLRSSLRQPLPEMVAVGFALCAVSGLVWGAVTWHYNEKIFRQLPSSKSDPTR